MTSPHCITVNRLLPHHPCEDVWNNFLKTFNNLDPDRFITIVELLDAGIPVPDVIWALRGLPESSLPAIKAFAIDCAESVLPIFESRFPAETRPRLSLETARRFLKGETTLEEMEKARADAYDAYAAYAVTDANAYAATYAYASTAANAYAATYAYAATDASAYAAYAAANAANAAANATTELARQAAFLRRRFS